MFSKTIVRGLLAVVLLTYAVSAQADVFNMPSGQTSLQFVTVGDVGNVPDPATGNLYGAVDRPYNIAKNDVTVAQYTVFLNAVAKTDAYGLYNSGMATLPWGCGISQYGSSGSYSYSVLPDSGTPGQPDYANYANFPVNLISWGDAARFCNWLQNGQPIGAQGNGTTETGAYTLNGAITGAALSLVTRNLGATCFIPTENEWYKAAYYRSGGTNAGYWLYPTKSNTAPINVLSTTGTNNANFNYSVWPNYFTPVGYFAASPGPYGTFDQGGNVWQWNETKNMRGGSFYDDSNSLDSSGRYGPGPNYESHLTGIRVASELFIWSGGGADAFWLTSSNWGGAAPAGSTLYFTGSTRLTNTNNNVTDTQFNGIAFDSSAGTFVLNGSAINLNGDVTNYSANLETININLALIGDRTFNVSAGSITLGGVVSGSSGLTKIGTGTLILSTSNTYSSFTTVSAGTLQIGNGGTTGSIATDVLNNAVLIFNRAGVLAYDKVISGSGQLVKSGTGIVALTGSNTYTGGTTVSSGTLQGTTTSLQGSITNNASLVFNQATDGTYGGVISGSGGFTKSGLGRLTLPEANTLSSTGSIAIAQGTLAAPFGVSHTGGGITLATGGTLEAAGQVNRAVSGVGIINATGSLFVGDAKQSGQFNQGGSSGVGGTLNIGSNTLVILASDTAILGSQTNLSDGGSLMTLHGAQLGNPKTPDATKVLTATGNATIDSDFVNNGIVHGPIGAGEKLKFTQFVTGGGALTGNIEFAGSYSPGNSPAIVSVENVLLDPTNLLIVEFAGDLPGEYDQLKISGVASLDGTLYGELLGGFTPSAGQRFDIFNGPTSGHFARIILPELNDGLSWNTSTLYSTGEVSVVPEPSAFALLGVGCLGLLGYRWRRRQFSETLIKIPPACPEDR